MRQLQCVELVDHKLITQHVGRVLYKMNVNERACHVLAEGSTAINPSC